MKRIIALTLLSIFVVSSSSNAFFGYWRNRCCGDRYERGCCRVRTCSERSCCNWR